MQECRNEGKCIKREVITIFSATTSFTVRIQTLWLLSCYLPAALSPTICHLLFWNTGGSLGVSWTIAHPCLCHDLPSNRLPCLYSSTWQPPMTLKSHTLGGHFFRDDELLWQRVEGYPITFMKSFQCYSSLPQLVFEPKVFAIISFKPYFTVTLIKI